MRGIKLATFALFAVAAFGAIAAPSASAFPEFKGAQNITFESLTSGGAPTLTMENAGVVGTITCEKMLTSGTILVGTMLIDGLHITFQGKCKEKIGSNEGTCTEPIKFKLVKGELGLQSSTNKKAVLLLKPESGTEFLKMSCTNGSTVFEGEIVGEFPTINKSGLNQYNKLLKNFELVFKSNPAGSVKQEIEEFLLLPSNLMTGIKPKVSGSFGGEFSLEAAQILDLSSSGEITT